MSLLQLTVLALVQGVTEFLPISSSAHLILVPVLFGWPDQGLLIDVAVHVGTLVAVMAFFGREVAAMLRGLADWREPGLLAQPGRRLAVLIVVATLPVVVVGLLARDWVAGDGRSIAVIGWATLGFGLILWLADRIGGTARRLDQIGLRDAFLIGCAQVLALIPGTSRSGITMTAARLLGYGREDGARFSLLLSIPTIAAAGLLMTRDLVRLGELRLGLDALLAASMAGFAALAAIALLLRWLRSATFLPFVLYRVVLGVILLAVAYRIV
jgi:undecaprenyl-diphosphatase